MNIVCLWHGQLCLWLPFDCTQGRLRRTHGCGDGSAVRGDGKYYDPSTKVPGPSCAQSSATYIAGTIAHEAFHIRHPHSNSLWEEYGASLTGDIVRDEIIRAGKGTSSDMRFQLSVFTVNINNPDRDQLANDLIDWFDHNELDIYFLPKPQGYGYDPLPP